MLKKTIRFKDLDDNLIEDTFYFNLNKGEVAELQLRTPGGLEEHLRKIVRNAKAEPGALVDFIKDFIRMAYGVRSGDNRRFMKSNEHYLEFYESDAYSVLFMELISDAEASADFFNGVVKSALDGKKIEDVQLPQEMTNLTPSEPTFKVKDRAADYTPQELRDLSDDEWTLVGRKFKGQMPKFMIAEGMRRMGVASPVEVQNHMEIKDTRPLWEKENRRPNHAELAQMTPDEFTAWHNSSK